MSAVLVIARDKVQMEKVNVDQPTFVIGRSKSCDLPLPDNMLSRQHCTIIESGARYTIKDNGSRNGTEVNGTVISGDVDLNDGDRITVGPFEITFYAAGSAGLADLPEIEEDAATRFVGAGDVQAVQDQAKQKGPVAEGAIVRVTVTTGPLKGSVYKEWHGDLTIGRGSDNDVILPDDAASNAHARIFRDKGQYWIEDFGSSNGTFVDNIRITNRKDLRHGQKIRIGGAVFQYTEIDPVQLKKKKRLIVITVVVFFVTILLVKLLQPEDKAAKYLAQGQNFLQQGDYETAMMAFDKVLEIDDTNAEAKQGNSQAKSQQEAAALLTEAQQAALEERYSDAEDICHRVLRLHPRHEAATRLLEVVKKVEESQIAVDAQNWQAAIDLMGKALETYPESVVLQERMALAVSELAAKTSLDAAGALIQEKKFAEARTSLADVAESSAYAPQIQTMLGEIGGLEEASRAHGAALAAYRDKDEAGALRLIAEGLAAAPNNEDLVNLREDIERVGPIARLIEGGEALLQSDDVDAINDMVRACESASSSRIESAEVARVKTRAAALMEQLQARLKTIAADAMAEGKQSLANNDRRSALQHFDRAARAQPSNEAAVVAASQIRQMLTPLAKEHFQQALVHEELEQFDLAIAEYNEVLQISVPGDRYYDRSVERLKRLDR